MSATLARGKIFLSVAIVRRGVTGWFRQPRGRPSAVSAKKMYRGFREMYSATSVGWGEVIASGPGVAGVVAYAIFTQRIPARQDQDGTAAAAAGSARFLVPFDNSGGFITAVAVANPSSTGSINVNIQLDSGAISHGSLTLPDQGHAAFVLPDQFPETAGQRGLAEFYVTGAVRGTPSLSMLALRFNASGAFTTAPVYGQSGTPIIGVTQGGGAK